jgi:hypothetical protein
MKTINPFILAIFLTLAISCSKKSDSVTPASASVSDQKAIVSSTSWRINSFTKPSENKTSDYNGYQFDFRSNGTLVVTYAGSTFNGNWNLSQSNSQPDDSGHHSGVENKLNILVSGNKQMNDISKDWKIIKLNTTEIWLADDNPASAEEVHFVRI